MPIGVSPPAIAGPPRGVAASPLTLAAPGASINMGRISVAPDVANDPPYRFDTPMSNHDLKTIAYRGGVVSFRIPSDWLEEYEPAGGGMFYAPGDRTGTLRLNVTTATIGHNTPLFPVNAEKALKPFADEHGVAVRPLASNLAMIRFDRASIDRGQPIVIRCWHIAHTVTETAIRIALFTYTLRAELFPHETSQTEMGLLDRELSAAEFAPSLGRTSPTGAKARPWWRFW